MKICALFPGYGSQFVGMGKDLYDQSRTMQEYFEEASNCLNINFVKLCFASSDADLARPEHAYPALFLLSSALYALLKEQGVQADMVAGYNQGEYAAMYAADGFSFPDGLYLLSKYATLYQELLASQDIIGIQVTGLSTQELTELCALVTRKKDFAKIAVYTTPLIHTVFGTPGAINAMQEHTGRQDHVKCIDVDPAIGIHSSEMDPVAASLKMYAEKVDFKDLTVPLMTNADAKEVRYQDQVKAAFIKQVHSPILWASVVEQLAAFDLFIIMGPGTHVQQLMQAAYPDKTCMTINTQTDIDAVLALITVHTEQPIRTENDDL